MNAYQGGWMFGVMMGFALGSLLFSWMGPSEKIVIDNGAYNVVASGKEIRLLQKVNKDGKDQGPFIILKGEEAKKLPKDGVFAKETVQKSETVITIKVIP